MAQAAPVSMCPMAETCRGMMEKRFSALVMMIPGMAFMVVGIMIVIWPSVLPWLVATACILAGSAMLLMVRFMVGSAPGSDVPEADPLRSRHQDELSVVR